MQRNRFCEKWCVRNGMWERGRQNDHQPLIPKVIILYYIICKHEIFQVKCAGEK